MNKLLVLAAIAASGVAGLSAGASAQNFPSRPITIIVANTAGTNVDASARIMAAEMTKDLGVPVVVENKPGGGQVIGTDYVARTAPADGYTLIIGSDATNALLPLTFKNLPFDVTKDFKWISGVGSINVVAVTGAKNPWKTWPEFVARAKANPGKTFVSQASAKNRMDWAYLQDTFGMKVEAVNYPSSGEATTALLQGELHADFATEPEAVGMKDTVRPLMMGIPSTRLQGVPLFSESGAGGIAVTTYIFGVRSATPQAAIDRLYAASTKALANPAVRDALDKAYVRPLDPKDATTEAVNKKFQSNVEAFGVLAKKINLQPQ